MIRSALAVLAGIVVLSLASFGIEAAVNPLLMALFPTAFPDETTLMANLPVRLFTMAYTLVSVAAGGYATAWIARRAGVRHAMAMGALQALMTLALWMSGTAPGNSPAWQWIAGIVLMIPAAWLGGMLQAGMLGATAREKLVRV